MDSHRGYNLFYSFPAFQIRLFGPVCLYSDLQKQSSRLIDFVENSDTAGYFAVKETHRGHPVVSETQGFCLRSEEQKSSQITEPNSSFIHSRKYKRD